MSEANYITIKNSIEEVRVCSNSTNTFNEYLLVQVYSPQTFEYYLIEKVRRGIYKITKIVEENGIAVLEETLGFSSISEEQMDYLIEQDSILSMNYNLGD